MSFLTISPVALVAYLDFYLFLNYINTFCLFFTWQCLILITMRALIYLARTGIKVSSMYIWKTLGAFVWDIPEYILKWKSSYSGMRIAPKQTLTCIIPIILIPDWSQTKMPLFYSRNVEADQPNSANENVVLPTVPTKFETASHLKSGK